jgi:chaperonin cofactor prefoldin
MTQEKSPTVNPNTAELEALQQLPGVGPAMAKRIVAARPFDSLSDLQRVSGIGPGVLERLRPFLTLAPAGAQGGEGEVTTMEVKASQAGAPVEREAPAPAVESLDAGIAPEAGIAEEQGPQPQAGVGLEAEAPEEVGEPPPSHEAPELEALEEPPEVEAAPAGEPQPAAERRPAMVTRAQAFWMAGISGVLALLLSLALNLGILAGLNQGWLVFVTPSQFNELRVQASGLADQANTLSQNVDGLRTRLDNLEALSGRLGVVEDAAKQLRSDVDGASGDVESLKTQADKLGTQVGGLAQQADKLGTQVDSLSQRADDLDAKTAALQAQNEQVQKFLSGLRDLLDGLFQPGGSSQ